MPLKGKVRMNKESLVGVSQLVYHQRYLLYLRVSQKMIIYSHLMDRMVDHATLCSYGQTSFHCSEPRGNFMNVINTECH